MLDLSLKNLLESKKEGFEKIWLIYNLTNDWDQCYIDNIIDDVKHGLIDTVFYSYQKCNN